MIMARFARTVVSGVPHHVTQAGDRRNKALFGGGNYALCLDLLSDNSTLARIQFRAHCLIPTTFTYSVISPHFSVCDALRNPAWTKLVKRASDWKWPSVVAVV